MIISTRSNLLQSKSINAWTAEINKPVCLPISSRKGVKETAYEPDWPRSCLTLIFPVQKIRCARMRGQASLVTRENEISEIGKKNISWIQPRGQFCFLTTWSFRSRAVRSIPFFSGVYFTTIVANDTTLCWTILVLFLVLLQFGWPHWKFRYRFPDSMMTPFDKVGWNSAT